jgi:hypothetical protein
MTWQPIETAPKSVDPINHASPVILVCWAGVPDSACLLIWKHNRRISSAIAAGKSNPRGLVAEYWGDPEEDDDYNLAYPGAGPTHWLPQPPIPGTDDAIRRADNLKRAFAEHDIPWPGEKRNIKGAAISDIVERLRKYEAVGGLPLSRLCGEAADEIERLHADTIDRGGIAPG